MNIHNTLNLPIFTLPRKSNSGTFPIFLEKLFKDFIQAIDNVNEGKIAEELKTNRKKLLKICNLLVKSANTYFAGFPSKAYFEFEEAMSILEDFLLLKKGDNRFNELTPYYRARKGDSIQFQRHEMFHIPFEERERVTSQRFSVPGLPCIYLSNSAYVCWEELRRPEISKMQISRYKLENINYNFLDISLTPSSMCKILDDISNKENLFYIKPTQEELLDLYNKISLNFILRWPLIAVCSIKVNKEDGAFKPEYIFPQFLLQWVTHNKFFDGIKYFSIEANLIDNSNCSKLINYVVPVKSVAPSGYCKELKQSFSLTNPVSWELLTIMNPEVTKHNREKFIKNLSKLGLGFNQTNTSLKLFDGKLMNYSHTIFGKLEIELSEMEFWKL